MTKEEKEQRKLGQERDRQAEIDAILQRSLKTRPPSDVDLRARLHLQPFGVLVEHRIDDMDKGLVAAEEAVSACQKITFQPTLALMFG